jgi:hypothetical protein
LSNPFCRFLVTKVRPYDNGEGRGELNKSREVKARWFRNCADRRQGT